MANNIINGLWIGSEVPFRQPSSGSVEVALGAYFHGFRFNPMGRTTCHLSESTSGAFTAHLAFEMNLHAFTQPFPFHRIGDDGRKVGKGAGAQSKAWSFPLGHTSVLKWSTIELKPWLLVGCPHLSTVT